MIFIESFYSFVFYFCQIVILTAFNCASNLNSNNNMKPSSPFTANNYIAF